MRSMLVVGLGRFGRHLAIRLAELGNEVMAIDTDEDAIDKIAPLVTTAQIGDCMDEEVIASLGVRNFDVCFVCIGENFQSSLEITSLLKEHGARHVVSKADRDLHAKFLLKIGADEIVYPERDMGYRAAMRFSVKNAFDYIELAPDYAIFEMSPPNPWIGKTIGNVDVRSRYNINIIGVKEGEHVLPMTSSGHVFAPGEHLLVAGSKKDIMKIVERT